MYIDTHCHLTDGRYKNVDEIIKNLNNIKLAICVGYDYQSSVKSLEIANKYDNIYCALGVHPHDCKTLTDKILEEFKELSKNKKVVAIGEIGLDFHYPGFSKTDQERTFIKQMELADNLNLPIIIHSRDCTDYLNNILVKNKHLIKNGGVMHCYSESAELVKFYTGLGLKISFAGPVTYTGAKTPVLAVLNTPLDKILSETDCPYLTPQEKRGELNYPNYVEFVVKKMAEILKISENMLKGLIYKNTLDVFKKIEAN